MLSAIGIFSPTFSFFRISKQNTHFYDLKISFLTAMKDFYDKHNFCNRDESLMLKYRLTTIKI